MPEEENISKQSVKHNRYIIRVPKDYTEEDIALIKVKLAEARKNGEDIVVSNDIEVYPMFRTEKEANDDADKAAEEKKEEDEKKEEEKKDGDEGSSNGQSSGESGEGDKQPAAKDVQDPKPADTKSSDESGGDGSSTEKQT